jgi:mediator of RNA polymerase II transcription subunit 4
MRLGMLGKTDLNINGHSLQAQTSVSEVPRATGEIPASAQNQFAWFPSGELHMSLSGQQSISLETSRAHKDASQDDASSDSSSSSSSDSQ